MNMYLDSIKRYKGKHEYRMVPRCTCGDIVIEGDHGLIKAMGSAMLEAGFSPDLEVGVYRGTMEVFAPAKLSLIAKEYRNGEQPEHLKKRDEDEIL